MKTWIFCLPGQGVTGTLSELRRIKEPTLYQWWEVCRSKNAVSYNTSSRYSRSLHLRPLDCETAKLVHFSIKWMQMILNFKTALHSRPHNWCFLCGLKWKEPLYRNNAPRDMEFSLCHEVKWAIRVWDKEVLLYLTWHVDFFSCSYRRRSVYCAE